MPLASAPFLLLGELVRSPEWWAAHFNVIIATAGAIAALLLLRSRVDARVLRQSLLVLFFASLLTNRLRDYNAEVFTATLVGVGILGIVTGRRLAGWMRSLSGLSTRPRRSAGWLSWQRLRPAGFGGCACCFRSPSQQR